MRRQISNCKVFIVKDCSRFKLKCDKNLFFIVRVVPYEGVRWVSKFQKIHFFAYLIIICNCKVFIVKDCSRFKLKCNIIFFFVRVVPY